MTVDEIKKYLEKFKVGRAFGIDLCNRFILILLQIKQIVSQCSQSQTVCESCKIL